MNAAVDTAIAVPAVSSNTRPLYWSLRRELWENKSLYIAPLVAAGVVIASALFNAFHLKEGVHLLAQLQPAQQRGVVNGIYGGIAFVITLTMGLVAWFYALDALHGERRDRSVLFWKSLPISDTTTVLSKLLTVLVVVPAIAFVAAIATQLVMLAIGTVLMLASGVNPAALWSNLQFVELTIVFLYGLLVLALWYAPIYAWLLLVSSWAKRSTFLWAVLPPLAILFFERMAFGTTYFLHMLQQRFGAGLGNAVDLPTMAERVAAGGDAVQGEIRVDAQLPEHALSALDPIGFLTDPYLWAGLAVAAAFIAGAVWMRRYREPI